VNRLPEENEMAEATRGFKRALLQAASQERAAGNLTGWELMRVRVAVAMRPARVLEAQSMVVEQACAAGLMQDAADLDGFDWEALLEFIRQLLPLILEIIAIFS
jgi:hypothetical protein